jgi:hypothetical protein
MKGKLSIDGCILGVLFEFLQEKKDSWPDQQVRPLIIMFKGCEFVAFLLSFQ